MPTNSFIRRSAVIGIAAVVFATASWATQLTSKKALTLEISKQVAAVAESHAVKNKWSVVIAIVDDGGHLLYLERMDNAQTGSIEVAIQKAKSATSYKRPTKVFDAGVAGGRTALVALPGAIPFEGGIPLSADGQVIGAIGVSGVTGAQDGMIAQAGVDGFSAIVE
jgi:glc operon protein GlcG